MYFGDAQRPWSEIQRRMKRATDLASSSTPQKLAGSPFSTTREKPVPTGSTKTRSLAASSGSGEAIDWKGGAPAPVASLGTITRRGPSIPMWSQIDDEPGPPLKANV